MPTPSVPETSTGSRYFFGISHSAPKPPMPASTSGRMVRLRERLDRLDQRVARVDVDAGVAVGELFRHARLGFYRDAAADPRHRGRRPSRTSTTSSPGRTPRRSRACARLAAGRAARGDRLPLGRRRQRPQPSAAARAARTNAALVIADDVERLDAPAQQRCSSPSMQPATAAPRCSPQAPRRRRSLALREDLRTRLAWGLVYQLRPLSDADKAAHLRAEAARARPAAARRGAGLPPDPPARATCRA